MITVGGCGWYWILRCSPPSRATNSSLTIFTICWPGVSDSRTSDPTARSRIRSTNARSHAEVDVRFEERDANLAQPDLDVFLGQPAAPGESLQGIGEPITECFEHGQAVTSVIVKRDRRSASTRSLRSSSAA